MMIRKDCEIYFATKKSLVKPNQAIVQGSLCKAVIKHRYNLKTLNNEGVHLTLPPRIISVQVKSRSTLHHGSVGASLKQNKSKPKET